MDNGEQQEPGLSPPYLTNVDEKLTGIQTSNTFDKNEISKSNPQGVFQGTTDQLGPEGDEYIPREIDPVGEVKVSKDGYPLDGRKYRCRTFQVPNRGK
jgi:hypothetical protein